MQQAVRAGIRLLVACLAASMLSGCREAADLSRLGDGSRLGNALSVVPANANGVFFSDLAAAEERLGFPGLDSQSDQIDIKAYRKKAFEEARWAFSQLSTYPRTVPELGWTVEDIEWAVETIGATRVYQMRDDLDMAVVADGFRAHGYLESEEEGVLRFVPESMTETVPSFATDVAVLPDERLVVLGPELDGVVDVVAGEERSLADDDGMSELLDEAEGVEFAFVLAGETSCEMSVGGRLPADVPEEVAAERVALHAPVASATFVRPLDNGSVGVRVVLSYADQEAAAADHQARTDFLRTGQHLTSTRPLAELLRVQGTERVGNVVRLDLEFAGGPTYGFQMIRQSDVPWLACPVH